MELNPFNKPMDNYNVDGLTLIISFQFQKPLEKRNPTTNFKNTLKKLHKSNMSFRMINNLKKLK